MLAAVYYNNSDIRLKEVPKPKIGSGEILVKVLASGICGTDVLEWYRIMKAPRILGHEIAGEITESKSEGFKVGQRVFVSHHVACGECKYCREGNHTACDTLHKGNYDPGGYSEFIRVPKMNVDKGTYLLPDNISFEEGTMIEPLACAVRAQRLIDIKNSHIVLILGSGVSGLLNIQLAKLKGAQVIATDVNDYKLDMARRFGADQALKADSDINIKADRIIICTGALKAVEQAFECIDKKGIILFFAIPSKNVEIPIVDFWRNEITATSSYGAASYDLEESLKLINDAKINIKDMITHKLPLTKIQEGFKIAAAAKESLKVVLIP
ncbi:MAG: alcohol dehydrogenase catalytic domain-containing protein [Candidatus Omnitrophica bacterium]|nr:alcohol dehydrogenase catalytic domain-containing protein [Candidatus Omnitrophota bacterium]